LEPEVPATAAAALLAAALGEIARARGMVQVAEDTGLDLPSTGRFVES
jgi:DNA-binding phage protein